MGNENELNLELLPATGLLTLKQLSKFLQVNESVVRENFKKEGVPILTYKRGHSRVSLDAITERMKRKLDEM